MSQHDERFDSGYFCGISLRSCSAVGTVAPTACAPVSTVSKSPQMIPACGVVRVVKNPIVPRAGNPGTEIGIETWGSMASGPTDHNRKVEFITESQTFHVAGVALRSVKSMFSVPPVELRPTSHTGSFGAQSVPRQLTLTL